MRQGFSRARETTFCTVSDKARSGRWCHAAGRASRASNSRSSAKEAMEATRAARRQAREILVLKLAKPGVMAARSSASITPARIQRRNCRWTLSALPNRAGISCQGRRESAT